jgi:hypothetical protein
MNSTSTIRWGFRWLLHVPRAPVAAVIVALCVQRAALPDEKMPESAAVEALEFAGYGFVFDRAIDPQGHVTEVALWKWNAEVTNILNAFPALREIASGGLEADEDAIFAWEPPDTLTTIILGESNLTDVAVEVFARAPSLQLLMLPEAQVQGTALRAVAKLKDLRTLDLRDNPVAPESLASLGECAELRQLNLSGVPLGDDDAEFLNLLTNLRTLVLSRTKISDATLERLEALENLRNLYVSSTEVTEEGVRRFKEQSLSRDPQTGRCRCLVIE